MESPYFRRLTESQTKRCSPRSPFFSSSPTSVQGSVLSLGPLLTSWANDRAGSICCRKVGLNSICTPCQNVISEAVRHFEDCEEFRAKYDTRTTEPLTAIPFSLGVGNFDGLSCLEIMSIKMERRVRHLCPKMCYLRAYNPSRDWWALRQVVAQQSNLSVTRLLQHWTCKLERRNSRDKCTQVVATTGAQKGVPLSGENDQKPNIDPEKKEENPRLQTTFVNRMTGQVCPHPFP